MTAHIPTIKGQGLEIPEQLFVVKRCIRSIIRRTKQSAKDQVALQSGTVRCKVLRSFRSGAFAFSIIGNLQAFVPGCNKICFSSLNGPNFKDIKLQFFAHHFIYLAHLDRFIVQKLICEISCPVYKYGSRCNFSCSGKDVFSMKAFTKKMSSYVLLVKSAISCPRKLSAILSNWICVFSKRVANLALSCRALYL